VQEQLGDATARRRQAMQAKDYYATQKTQVAAQPSDPVEQFLVANQGSFSKEDQDWIRTNRRYATDPNFRQRVIDAHKDAVGKSIAPRSPEYYEHLSRAGYMRSETPQPAATDRPQQQAAPTGYEGGDATSDTGAPAGNDEPEIVIRGENMPTNDGPAFNRRADNPQARAAGPGAMRSAIAAAPSRRPVNAPGRRTILELTPGERDTALALAPHLFDEETLKGGEPAILRAYNELKNSPSAERIRQQWRDRAGLSI
jgi:hypothetical protein